MIHFLTNNSITLTLSAKYRLDIGKASADCQQRGTVSANMHTRSILDRVSTDISIDSRLLHDRVSTDVSVDSGPVLDRVSTDISVDTRPIVSVDGT